MIDSEGAPGSDRLKRTVRRGAARLALLGVLSLLTLGSGGCGLIGGSPAPTASPAASPTLLPPPKPEPGIMLSPSPLGSPPPLGSPSPSVPPTRVPPPDLNAKPQPSASSASAPRATVANTEGQGANMRVEPAPSGQLVRTVREGAELELIGDEREAAGRKWRNVRDPGDGASGWIVSELLSPSAPGEPPAAAPAPAPAPSPSPAAKPAAAPKPAGDAKPAGSPPALVPPGLAPQASAPTGPPPANLPPGAAKPAQRINDADRAYLGVLQGPVDALGKSISTANEQIERAGGKPGIASDPAWRQDTQAVIDSLRDASARIRAAQPGPATGGVQRYATNAADRADEAADGLSVALDSGDTRGLQNVRTTLVRMLAEINNMNLTLLDLQ